MQVPLQITFRHMAPSAAVEDRFREQVAYLEQHFENISSCRVVIDVPPAHRNKGGPFAVSIDMTIPGRELVATSGRTDQAEHADAYVAIRDAFDALERQLDGFVRRRRDVAKQRAHAMT
jgi:ribosomal subunit interface protein